MSTVVTPAWLNERLPDVQVLDCTWHLPTSDRTGRDDFESRRIPGAAFFDIDGVCDKSSSMPHMLPSVDEFAQAVTSLGVSNDSTVVCYDGVGMFTAPRAWWMFKYFGLEPKVLSGGLPAWERAGFAIDTAKPADPTASSAPFQCRQVDISKVWTHGQIVENQRLKDMTVVLDARSGPRYEGSAAEPRAGLPSGHMPGSVSVPFNTLLTEGMSTLLPATELKQLLDPHVLPSCGNAVTVSCGSGVTACVIALAIQETYGDAVRVNLFDGSWTEYGTETVKPKLRALLDALETVGDPDIDMAMSNLTAKAPLIKPGCEALIIAIDARLEHIRSWPGQQAKRLEHIRELAKELQDSHVL